MPTYDDVYGGNSVKATDLRGDTVVRIESYDFVQFPAKSRAGHEYMKTMVRLKFFKTEKRFTCNPTNAKTIRELYGPDFDAWVGKQIVLYPTTTQFGMDTVACIRIRPESPTKQIEHVPAPNGGPKVPLEHYTQEHPTHISSSMRPIRAVATPQLQKAMANELPEDEEIPF